MTSMPPPPPPAEKPDDKYWGQNGEQNDGDHDNGSQFTVGKAMPE